MKIRFIVVGRTASGKTSFIDIVRKKMDIKKIPNFFLETATTRKPRDEKDKLEYTFLSNEEFENTEFLASINPFDGLWYGVLKKKNDKEGAGFFSPISMSYAKDTAEGLNYENVYFIVMNISREERHKRLLNRGDTEEEISKRFGVEDREGDYDLSNLPKGSLIFEDDNATTEEMAEIVMQKFFT